MSYCDVYFIAVDFGYRGSCIKRFAQHEGCKTVTCFLIVLVRQFKLKLDSICDANSSLLYDVHTCVELCKLFSKILHSLHQRTCTLSKP